MRIELGADGTTQRFDFFHEGFRTQCGTRYQVGVTSDVFDEGVQ